MKGREGHKVEQIQVKPNVPLNLLKAVSFLTGIIPLIMGIGKWIARRQHRFFVAPQISPPTSQPELPKKSEPKTKLPAANPQKIQEIAEEIRHFKSNVLRIFNQPGEVKEATDLGLSPEQKEYLQKIEWNNPRRLVNGKAIRRGSKHCLLFRSYAKCRVQTAGRSTKG
ncbi:hypothetical protein [Parachlamydia sp. AcF125]|uniref:hypothetical protein n=1 Tax=Parachlamydia sp. AcF125 TaxID=2795736 RepID=UPI001BD849C8|nr:hypothetical protein [Parachlamydia sp. AcF125]MBS4168754.1 hypothetical protein [Parachlamydia sp. AcF125]